MSGTDRLMQKLGMTVPLMLAPMALVSGGHLAAAVSRAGGFGIIGGGYGDRDWLLRELDAAGSTPVGVGFITWALQDQPELLDLALSRKPRAIFLSFGDVAAFAPKIRDACVPLVVQVQTVAGAREAVASGATVIVAQGSEAGGHGGARGTLALVPAVRDVIGDVPLVAAGGIADGRGMAAALMLGADAVLCGTAFYAAEESLAHPACRQAALHASGDGTTRSSVFDAARGINWPQPWTLRACRNAFHNRWEGNLEAMSDGHREAYAKAAAAGETDTTAVIVGEAVDLVKASEPATRIVTRITNEANDLLSAALQLCWPATNGSVG